MRTEFFDLPKAVQTRQIDLAKRMIQQAKMEFTTLKTKLSDEDADNINKALLYVHRAEVLLGGDCIIPGCEWHNFTFEEQSGDLIPNACDSCKRGGDCGHCWKIYQTHCGKAYCAAVHTQPCSAV